MTSAYSVRPYTLWRDGRESGVSPSGEGADVINRTMYFCNPRFTQRASKFLNRSHITHTSHLTFTSVFLILRQSAEGPFDKVVELIMLIKFRFLAEGFLQDVF